jgi:hypothetical protein
MPSLAKRVVLAAVGLYLATWHSPSECANLDSGNLAAMNRKSVMNVISWMRLRGGKADVQPDDDDDMAGGDPMMMQDDAAVMRAMKSAEKHKSPEELRKSTKAAWNKIQKLATDGKLEVNVGGDTTIPLFGDFLPCKFCSRKVHPAF